MFIISVIQLTVNNHKYLVTMNIVNLCQAPKQWRLTNATVINKQKTIKRSC